VLDAGMNATWYLVQWYHTVPGMPSKSPNYGKLWQYFILRDIIIFQVYW